jgi:hypothetical protein
MIWFSGELFHGFPQGGLSMGGKPKFLGKGKKNKSKKKGKGKKKKK